MAKRLTVPLTHREFLKWCGLAAAGVGAAAASQFVTPPKTALATPTTFTDDVYISPGKLGVGTTTPIAPLEVTGYGASGSNFYIQRLYAQDTGVSGAGYVFRGLHIDADFSGPGTPTLIGLDVDVSGAGAATRHAALFQGGNVGVGTTSPGNRLEIAGGGLWLSSQSYESGKPNGPGKVAIYRDTGGNGYLRFGAYDALTGFIMTSGAVPGGSDVNPFIVEPGAPNTVRITSLGRVGIGTENPAGKLHVDPGTDGSVYVHNAWPQGQAVGNYVQLGIGVAVVRSAVRVTRTGVQEWEQRLGLLTIPDNQTFTEQTLILAHDPGRSTTGRWYRPIVAGKTPISISDMVEVRAAVDTLRVAADLPPVAWEGRSAEDRTFRAGETPIRARHFTQLREAIADLWRIAEIGPLPEFTGGPIVPGTRLIRVSDPLDLRRWVEQYEAAVPERAARAVQLYDEYTAAYPELVLSPLPRIHDGSGTRRHRPRLTEEWDAAGFSRYGYDAQGRLIWRLRFVDDRAYAVRYAYQADGLLHSIVYPVADQESDDAPMATYQYTDQGWLLGVETSLGLGRVAKPVPGTRGKDWVDGMLKLSEFPRPTARSIRITRDLHGTPVKMVDGETSRVWVDGAPPRQESGAGVVAAKPLATVAWGTPAGRQPLSAAYALWSALDATGRVIGLFEP